MNPGGKRVFSHEEAFGELGALALGGLSAVEVDAIVEHVGQCAICTAELARMSDVAAALAISTQGAGPAMTPARSAAIRAGLVERARLDAASRQKAVAPVVAPESPSVGGMESARD